MVIDFELLDTRALSKRAKQRQGETQRGRKKKDAQLISQPKKALSKNGVKDLPKISPWPLERGKL